MTNAADRSGRHDIPPGELTARELAKRAGTTVRTIHYYTAEGLLPAPLGSTRGATYSVAHLARLRLITALRDEGLSLAGIRARVSRLTDEQALEAGEAFDRHLATGAAAPFSPLGLIDAVASRVADAPGDEVGSSAPYTATSRAPRAAGAPGPHVATLRDTDSAREYLDRLLRKPATAPQAPLPMPPSRPQPQPLSTPNAPLRAEAWYHVRVADGVELRVREDRYYQAKGRLSAVVDGMRAMLTRYGLLGPDPPDDDAGRRSTSSEST